MYLTQRAYKRLDHILTRYLNTSRLLITDGFDNNVYNLPSLKNLYHASLQTFLKYDTRSYLR